MGLSQSKLDPCIYFKIVDESNMIFMPSYVDDLLLFTNNQETNSYIKEQLHKQFKMKDLGDLSYCIGIHVERDRKKGIIYLDQKKYILEVLKKYGMSDCKSVRTPMDTNTKFQGNENSDDAKILTDIPYQDIVYFTSH